MIKITFIIPLYNRASLILQTLESLVQLPSEYVTVIIVDDCSDDNGPEIVTDFIKCQPNFSLVSRLNYSKSKGASVCRNYGLSLAQSEYVHFVDSDDLVDINAYNIINNAILNNSANDFWVFQTQWFDHEIGDRIEMQTSLSDRNIIDRFVDEKNVWNNFGPVWRRSSLLKLGGFTEEYKSFQDWDLMMRALLHHYLFGFFNLDQPIGYYRQYSANTISNNRFDETHILSNYKMVIAIYELMLEVNLENELRRRYLANFATKILLRTLFDKKTIVNKLFEELITQPQKLFKKEEVIFIKNEYKLRKGYLFNLSSFYRNLRKNKLLKSEYAYLFFKENI